MSIEAEDVLGTTTGGVAGALAIDKLASTPTLADTGIGTGLILAAGLAIVACVLTISYAITPDAKPRHAKQSK